MCAEERDYLSLLKIIAYVRHLDAILALTCRVQGRSGPTLGALCDQHPDRTGKYWIGKIQLLSRIGCLALVAPVMGKTWEKGREAEGIAVLHLEE